MNQVDPVMMYAAESKTTLIAEILPTRRAVVSTTNSSFLMRPQAGPQKNSPSENKCAMVPKTPSNKEAGRLVLATQADPKPSTFRRKDEDHGHS